MDEERKVNMMSVDLALKREVAYRKKLARLYPEDECRNEVLPQEAPEPEPEPSSSTISVSTILSQDPVSCPCPNMASSIHTTATATTTTKEKTSGSSFQWAEPVYISNKANFFCKICKVSCSGSISFRQHIKGQKHKANLKKKQPARSGENACKKSHIRRHEEVEIQFNGQKRKAKCEEGKGSQQLWCQLCQVACSHEDTYWLHLKGKAHLNNLKARGL